MAVERVLTDVTEAQLPLLKSILEEGGFDVKISPQGNGLFTLTGTKKNGMSSELNQADRNDTNDRDTPAAAQIQRVLTDIPEEKLNLHKLLLVADGFTIAVERNQGGGLFTLIATKASQVVSGNDDGIAEPDTDPTPGKKDTSPSVVDVARKAGLHAEAAAFLAAIADGESTAWNELFGGGTFDSYVDFPQWPGKVTPAGPTHAAGRFQFQPGTWESIAGQLGLTNYGKAAQVLGAWGNAQKVYARKTGAKLEDALLAGNLEQVARQLRSEWTGGANERFPARYQAHLETVVRSITSRLDDGSRRVAIDPSIAPKSVEDVPFANLTATEHAWPINNANPDRTVSYIASNGAIIGRSGRVFGAARQGRRHVGIDLFAAEGDEIVACESGVIVGLQHFLGSTQAMFIQCDSGIVINYGELRDLSWLNFNVRIGSRVSAGQPVGIVGSTGMLHLEIYRSGTVSNQRWPEDDPPPPDIFNPTLYLIELSAT